MGDAKGMVNYVYFILYGKCRVIEHMIISEELVGNKVKYKLYNPKDESVSKNSSLKNISTIKTKTEDKIKGNDQLKETIDEVELIS